MTTTLVKRANSSMRRNLLAVRPSRFSFSILGYKWIAVVHQFSFPTASERQPESLGLCSRLDFAYDVLPLGTEEGHHAKVSKKIIH